MQVVMPRHHDNVPLTGRELLGRSREPQAGGGAFAHSNPSHLSPTAGPRGKLRQNAHSLPFLFEASSSSHTEERISEADCVSFIGLFRLFLGASRQRLLVLLGTSPNLAPR